MFDLNLMDGWMGEMDGLTFIMTLDRQHLIRWRKHSLDYLINRRRECKSNANNRGDMDTT